MTDSSLLPICPTWHARKCMRWQSYYQKLFFLNCLIDLIFGREVFKSQGQVMTILLFISFRRTEGDGVNVHVLIQFLCFLYLSPCFIFFPCVVFWCSDENVFDSLVNNMINQDLAMRAVLEEAELLVFTSYTCLCLIGVSFHFLNFFLIIYIYFNLLDLFYLVAFLFLLQILFSLVCSKHKKVIP